MSQRSKQVDKEKRTIQGGTRNQKNTSPAKVIDRKQSEPSPDGTKRRAFRGKNQSMFVPNEKTDEP